jgi:PKD repeat protein
MPISWFVLIGLPLKFREAFLEYESNSKCKSDIYTGVNEGCSMLMYQGHGSPTTWASFNTGDVGGFTNKDKYPFVISLGCSTGKFDMPTDNSICEEFVMAVDKGGIASWGPSRTAYASLVSTYERFSQKVYRDGGRIIGAEACASMISASSTYHCTILTFFGDPAMTYGLPFMDINITTEYNLQEKGQICNVKGYMNSTFSGDVNLTVRDMTNWDILTSEDSTVTNGVFDVDLLISTLAPSDTYRIFAYAYDTGTYRDGLEYREIEIVDPKPNLKINPNDVTYSPPYIRIGEMVTINASIVNWGPRPSGDFKVAFYDGMVGPEYLLGDVMCTSIDREGRGNVTFQYDTTNKSGDRDIYVKADYENLIDELEENDNTALKIIPVMKPPVCNLGDDKESFRYIDTVFSSAMCYSPDGYIDNYSWDFGDGHTSFEQNPSNRYMELGDYNVTLVVIDTNNLTDSDVMKVSIINSQPVAGFLVEPEAGYFTTPFIFNNTSYDNDIGDLVYEWDFGDGETSSEEAPVHYFKKKGVIPVRLTVYDEDGGNSTFAKDVSILNTGPTAVATASKVNVSKGEQIQFSAWESSDIDDPSLDYRWTFGSSDVKNECNVTYGFQRFGMHTVSLQVTDSGGKSDSVSLKIQVNNLAPDLVIEVSPDEGTIDTRFNITITATDPDGWIAGMFIDTGDGEWLNTTFDTNPGTEFFYPYKSASNKDKTIRAFVEDNDGAQSGIKSATINLNNIDPTVDLGKDEIIIDEDDQVIFYPMASDPDGRIVKYQYDLDGDGSFDEETTEDRFTYVFTKAGNFTITVRAVDNDAGWAEDTVHVWVKEKPVEPEINDTPVEPPPDEEESNLGYVVAGILIVALIVAIVVIVLVVLVLRRRKEKEGEPEKEEEEEEEADMQPTTEEQPPMDIDALRDLLSPEVIAQLSQKPKDEAASPVDEEQSPVDEDEGPEIMGKPVSDEDLIDFVKPEDDRLNFVGPDEDISELDDLDLYDEASDDEIEFDDDDDDEWDDDDVDAVWDDDDEEVEWE